MSPSTEAGRRLLEQAVWEAAVNGSSMGVLTAATRRKVDDAIAAIEAEARSGDYMDGYAHGASDERVALLAELEAGDFLANELYVAIVQPGLTWWDDLTPHMQEHYRRAARRVLDLIRKAGAR